MSNPFAWSPGPVKQRKRYVAPLRSWKQWHAATKEEQMQAIERAIARAHKQRPDLFAPEPPEDDT